jgi:hypothetical protein
LGSENLREEIVERVGIGFLLGFVWGVNLCGKKLLREGWDRVSPRVCLGSELLREEIAERDSRID